MILADKIINERKKNGWSQENLAEKLGVSRQSVSKWESAQSVPDIQKILKMAELFGVTTDYLLKDEFEPELPSAGYAEFPEYTVSSDDEPERMLRTVTMEEANEYLQLEQVNSRKISNAVSLCIASPVLLVFLAGLTTYPGFHLSEKLAAVIGVPVLLLMVAAAVYMFIMSGVRMEPYQFLDKECFETEYGVDGMAKERRRDYLSGHSGDIALGVILCVISAIPLIAVSCMEAPDVIICAAVSVLLLIVALGVNRIVRHAVIKGSFNKILQENEFSKREKSKSRHIDTVAGIYWTLITAAYLAWSFISGAWDRTWIIWPVAGVLFAVIAGITKALTKEEKF